MRDGDGLSTRAAPIAALALAAALATTLAATGTRTACRAYHPTTVAVSAATSEGATTVAASAAISYALTPSPCIATGGTSHMQLGNERIRVISV